jgi:large subunit ribosomal protein L7e
MDQGRQKKKDEQEKRAGGKKILLPEVYTSCQMKQQRNYVQYKRNKNQSLKCKSDLQSLVLAKDQRVPLDVLLCVVRIKESRNASPQAQKILNELGLKEINNCAFLMSTVDNIKKLLLIANYIGYGQPTKKTVDDAIRKRGYLKTADHKRMPISDNILIEELLGAQGVICIEDVIDSFWNCKKNQAVYEAVRQVLWPIQLAALKDSIAEASVKHEASGRQYSKTKTVSHKGGYLGMMGASVNEYVARLI